MVTLRDTSSWSIEWRRPRPRLPELLLNSSPELHGSEEWQQLIATWSKTPPVIHLAQPSSSLPLQKLSEHDALQTLVHCAGGWRSELLSANLPMNLMRFDVFVDISVFLVSIPPSFGGNPVSGVTLAPLLLA